MEDREIRLRGFLSCYLPVTHLGTDDDFFASGLATSLFAMQIVLFVEQEFGVVVEDDDLDLENFNTVRGILRFVERKQAAA